MHFGSACLVSCLSPRRRRLAGIVLGEFRVCVSASKIECVRPVFCVGRMCLPGATLADFFYVCVRVWLPLGAVRSAGFAICIASVDWRAMSAKDVQSTAAPVAGGAMPGRQGGSLEAR